MTDPTALGLSSLASEILATNPGAYERLVTASASQGAGGGHDAVGKLERIASSSELFARPVQSRQDADAALAGLWLWHDELDRSHTISQGIASETGSFWHAIMHRREGDFSNAKYWYARCRHHPVLADVPLLAESTLLSQPGMKAAERWLRSGWDAEGFVDLVRDVHQRPADPRYPVAVRLQQLEWRALFAHCARAAVGE